MLLAMIAIDTAIADLIERLKAPGITINAVAKAGGASVGSVWTLRSAASTAEVGMTAKTLRQIECGLLAVERDLKCSGGAGHAG